MQLNPQIKVFNSVNRLKPAEEGELPKRAPIRMMTGRADLMSVPVVNF